jgi:hypothetical protein
VKKKLFVTSALALSIASGSNAQVPSKNVQQTADEIRNEATRRNNDSAGRPLPLITTWTPGAYPRALGFDPAYQLSLIEKGHHLMLNFQLADIPKDAAADKEALDKSRVYYEAPLKRAAELKLPITLSGAEWEYHLTHDPKYFDLPPEQNPNVVTPDGKVLKMVSPFGPVALWREVGERWISTQLMKQIQEWYPDPSRVILLSNNEAPDLVWRNVEQDARYLAKYGKGRSDEFKRKVVGDGWIERYNALQAGMRDALSKSWQSKVRFVGYGESGAQNLGREWDWMDYSLYTSDRIEPSPLAWDGGSGNYYTAFYNRLTDYRVLSPQIDSMNWIFMKKKMFQLKPDFWYEVSIWDGHFPEKKENDMRARYESLGQKYTTARYGGYAQFGLWLVRPRALREYGGYTGGVGWFESTATTDPWTLTLAAGVDRVYQNDTLKHFWRKGTLVPNRAYAHPYQIAIPEEYRKEDRWFLLDTNLDAPRPWTLETEIPVYSMALVEGVKGGRRWLVYAHSPLQDRKNVEITIPEYSKVTVDVPVAGAFYVVEEKTKKVQAIF